MIKIIYKHYVLCVDEEVNVNVKGAMEVSSRSGKIVADATCCPHPNTHHCQGALSIMSFKKNWLSIKKKTSDLTEKNLVNRFQKEASQEEYEERKI